MGSASDEEYEVVIVKYGSRRTLRHEVFLNYHLYEEPDADVDMDYYVWIVRNENRTIVVDTGYSEETARRRGRTFTVTPAEAFERLGVADGPELTVVLTHGHYDHVGNIGCFPTARFVMAEAEYGFWTGAFARRKQFHYSIEDDEITALAALRDSGRLTLTTGDPDIAPGVRILEVGGHTPGQLMVHVATSEGPVLLTSDVMHYYEEYERDYPFALTADVPRAYAAFDLIREMERTDRIAHLVSGHDPSMFDRFKPETTGPLAGLLATIGAGSRGTR
jgi:glyoxylase-like metal-dependent hydrolase (beta-lactamase superfamily II)